MSFLTTVLVLVAGTAMSAFSTVPSAAAPAVSVQPAETRPAGEQGFANADELLTALEESGKGLEELAAGVKYDRTFEIQGDRQIRVGKLNFVGGQPSAEDPSRMEGRKFAIVFDKFWIGNEMREQKRQYIFDGEFLYERIPEERLQLERRIVPAGEKFDPLKIGEGPLPIPIGQRKADILARYDAALVPATEGIDPEADPDPAMRQREMEMLRIAGDAVQLKLTPKPGADDEFEEIRLWYTRGAADQLLPRMARTVNRAGDVSVVTLINPKTKMAGEVGKASLIDPKLFDTAAPEGWVVDRKDIRKALEGER